MKMLIKKNIRIFRLGKNLLSLALSLTWSRISQADSFYFTVKALFSLREGLLERGGGLINHSK